MLDIHVRKSLLAELRDSCPQKRVDLQNAFNKNKRTQTRLGQVKFQFEH